MQGAERQCEAFLRETTSWLKSDALGHLPQIINAKFTVLYDYLFLSCNWKPLVTELKCEMQPIGLSKTWKDC